MPLVKGYSATTFAKNVHTSRLEGKSTKQAIAIAYKVGKEALKRAGKRFTKKVDTEWTAAIAKGMRGTSKASIARTTKVSNVRLERDKYGRARVLDGSRHLNHQEIAKRTGHRIEFKPLSQTHTSWGGPVTAHMRAAYAARARKGVHKYSVITMWGRGSTGRSRMSSITAPSPKEAAAKILKRLGSEHIVVRVEERW